MMAETKIKPNQGGCCALTRNAEPRGAAPSLVGPAATSHYQRSRDPGQVKGQAVDVLDPVLLPRSQAVILNVLR